MTEHPIPNEEADLLLHKFITQQTRLEVSFISKGESIRSIFTGYLLSFTTKQGLVIGSESRSAGESAPPCWISFMEPLIGATCYYVDETETEADYSKGSRLALFLPSGDRLLLTVLL